MAEYINPTPILTAGNMSGNLTSLTQNVLHSRYVTVQCVYTGSPVGSLALQASVDGITFVTALTQTVNGADSTLFNLPLYASPKVRVVYTATSGSGTLDIKLSAKE